jgi:hypothetical protein
MQHAPAKLDKKVLLLSRVLHGYTAGWIIMGTGTVLHETCGVGGTRGFLSHTQTNKHKNVRKSYMYDLRMFLFPQKLNIPNKKDKK